MNNDSTNGYLIKQIIDVYIYVKYIQCKLHNI